MSIQERFLFRTVRPDEVDLVAEIENVCFPPNEACSHEHMEERVLAAPELFLIAEERATKTVAGFLNGLSTEEAVFRDEFFTDIRTYDPNGHTVMLLGLDVLPPFRGQGLATALMEEYKNRERANGRHRLVLTCLEDKVEMYKKMGYRDLGLSASVWGDEAWHEMDVTL